MKTIITFCLVCVAFFSTAQESLLDDYRAEDYGQGTSIGLNIFGDGLGLMLRRTLGSQDQIEINPSFWILGIQDVNDDVTWYGGAFLRAGYNFYMGNTLKIKGNEHRIKEKYRKHYISVKPGIGTSVVEGAGVAFTWHRETFRNKNAKAARGLDLGVEYRSYFGEPTGVQFRNYYGVYLRIDWSWYR